MLAERGTGATFGDRHDSRICSMQAWRRAGLTSFPGACLLQNEFVQRQIGDRLAKTGILRLTAVSSSVRKSLAKAIASRLLVFTCSPGISRNERWRRRCRP